MNRMQIKERDVCRVTPDYWLLWTGRTAEYFYKRPVEQARTPIRVHIEGRNEEYELYHAPQSDYSDLGG